MGLLGNGFRHNLTGRISTATTALDGCNASTIPASCNLTAMRRNLLTGLTSKQASVPSGKRHPNVWLMAQEGGAISSYKRTNMRIDGSAAAEMGFPRTGSTTITITGSAVGGLIAGATGSTTISITGSASIQAVLSATGSTTISMGGAAALGAIASVTGSTTLSITGSCAIEALGYMTGTTIETAELTPDGIARAVWSAVAADNNTAGTMGQKLNTASSGGVDTGALATAVWANPSRTLTSAGSTLTAADVWAYSDRTLTDQPDPWATVLEDGETAAGILRMLAAVAVGDATGLTGGAVSFKSLDGAKARVTGTVAGGTRTVAARDGD